MGTGACRSSTSPDFYYLQRFDSSGNFLSIVCMEPGIVVGCPQVTPFSVQPSNIAIDRNGNIYVSNIYPLGGGYNVVKLSSAGAYLSVFGNGKFGSPAGIAFESSGHIVVADSVNSRVEVFDSSGAYLSQFGSTGSGNGQFSAPLGIAVDPLGDIY